jgi:hypothetical protein
MTYSVVWLDGSARGKYCGEFRHLDQRDPKSPFYYGGIIAQAMSENGIQWNRGAYAIYADEKSRLVEFEFR